MQQQQQVKELQQQQQQKRNRQSYLQRVHKCSKHTLTHIHTHAGDLSLTPAITSIRTAKSSKATTGCQAGRRSHLSRSSYEPSDIARHTHTPVHARTRLQ